MTAIKGARAGPGERSSPRNGLPEPVPYVYRQQRRNTYAARIARRNAQAAGQPPALAAGPGETLGVAVRGRVPFADLGAVRAERRELRSGELGVPVEDREPGAADPVAGTG